MHLDLGLGLGLGHWSFIWFRAFSKAYAFQNSKLTNSITLNYIHYTKAWLRLTYLMNLEENQGFLVQFLALNILICYRYRNDNVSECRVNFSEPPMYSDLQTGIQQ